MATTATAAATTWAEQLLGAIGGAINQTTVGAVVAWEHAESGSTPTARNNPLNVAVMFPGGVTPGPSGRTYPTASPVNTLGGGLGVAQFGSWTTGVSATATRLEQTPRYSGVLAQLQSGTTTPQLSGAVVASGWGTETFASGAPATLAAAKTTTGTVTGATAAGYPVPGAGQTWLSPGEKTYSIVTPSIVPGVSATAPTTPSFGDNPIGDLATALRWSTAWGGWAILTAFVFLVGLILILLGLVLLGAVLFGPVTGGIAGRTPFAVWSRATKPLTTEARTKRSTRRARNVEARTRLTTARARRSTRDEATRILKETTRSNREFARRSVPKPSKGQRPGSLGGTAPGRTLRS